MKKNISRCGTESIYLLTTFPLSVCYFCTVIALLPTAIGTIIVWVGLPLLVATLGLARGWAALERQRVRIVGVEIETPPPLASGKGFFGNVLAVTKQGYNWRSVGYSLLSMPISAITFSITVSWWAAALGGLTYWLWERFLPLTQNPNGLAELLHLPISNAQVNLIIGVVFAITLPPIIHALAVMQVGLAKILLSGSRKDLEQRIDSLQATKNAATDAELSSLRKMERDLHDGPQQGLIRVGMDLNTAERRLDSGDTETARGIINEAKSQVSQTLGELRNLSRGIAPPILLDRGLVVALTTLAAGASVRVTFDTSLAEDVRLPLPVENAVYFCASEALANITKHAAATCAQISLTVTDQVVLTVSDDGSGGAEIIPGHGLDGLSERAASVGGKLTVTGTHGYGSVIRLEIPQG